MSKIKDLILFLLIPFQKFLQRTGNVEPLMLESQVVAIKQLAKAGDILLSFETGRPTSKLIKGYYDHAAIVTSEISVMEAVGDIFKNGVNIGGVREVPIHQWLQTKDSVALIRPIYTDAKIPFFSDLINKLAAANSYSYKGKKYDYRFNKVNNEVYCSELVYLCYKKEDDTFLDEIESEEILPHDFYELTKSNGRFHLIAEYRND